MNRDWMRDKFEGLADFVYPSGIYCVICGNYIDKTRTYSMCDHCIRHIDWGNIKVDLASLPDYLENSEYVDSVRACFKYGLYGRRLIFELKYNDHSYVARICGKIAADRIANDPDAEEILACDIVTGVPVSAARIKKRGYNQAEKIAKYFCAELACQRQAGRQGALRHEPDLICRVKDTEALRSLSPRERSERLAGAFAINPKKAKLACGKKVVLIDDIHTTGATINHCAEALKRAGAAEVHVLVLASRVKDRDERLAERDFAGDESFAASEKFAADEDFAQDEELCEK